MIRLGDKYHAEEVLSKGKQRLTRRLPGDIEEWNALYDYGPLASDPDAISIANTARLILSRTMHLRALYLAPS